MTAEIERKFLVEQVPPGLELGPGEPMRQGYLAEEGDVALRVRITDHGAVLTVKAGSGLRRTEVERALDADEAEELWAHADGRRIEKVRHRLALDATATAELDVYAGALDGLRTVEVEFGSVGAAAAFAPPPWFGVELTDEPGWTNAELARSGRPPLPPFP